MKFDIIGVKDSKQKIFSYDNIENVLTDADGNKFEYDSIKPINAKESHPFSPHNPLKKSKKVTKLKIQLGLSCNYSCEYCSQRFVERADETSFKNVDDFLKRIDVLEFDEKAGLKIELWGGEPFVYWKTIKPLVEGLKMKFAFWLNKPHYSIITNGSILTEEIIEWLLDNMTTMAISHDGPGQWVRGPDPFEDKEHAERVLRLYKIVRSGTRHLKHMSFNAMLNAKNYSRDSIRKWFIDFTNDPNVHIGEGGLVDAYDEGGIGMSLDSKQAHFEFRKTAFGELFVKNPEEDLGYPNLVTKLNYFIEGVLSHRQAKYVSQKCGMDDENTIAVDLLGNVLTCQNVSSAAINYNGQPHLSGNIADMDNVRVTTSTHWRERKECSGCPVLHICQGSCMFTTDEYWHYSCNNAYSDALVIFALAFEKITGHIPVYIDGIDLPDMRKDVFGTILTHDEDPIKHIKSGKKPFPVAVVAI